MRCDLLPREYKAVRHLLESAPIASRCAPHIGDEDIDFSGVFAAAQTMSRGERLLVRVAYDLWSATRTVAIWEIARGLDSQAFERVLAALRMCRGAYPAARSDWLLAT